MLAEVRWWLQGVTVQVRGVFRHLWMLLPVKELRSDLLRLVLLSEIERSRLCFEGAEETIQRSMDFVSCYLGYAVPFSNLHLMVSSSYGYFQLLGMV